MNETITIAEMREMSLTDIMLRLGVSCEIACGVKAAFEFLAENTTQQNEE